MIRRTALVLLLALTACSPVALLEESEAPAVATDASWWPCWAADYPCDEEG